MNDEYNAGSFRKIPEGLDVNDKRKRGVSGKSRRDFL